MKSYVLPTKYCNPENVVLQYGTNTNEISSSIIEVALFCKSYNNYVLTSGIVSYSEKLNTEATVVNRHLINECRKGKGSIYFISNLNINSKHDCNSKRLYSKSFICLEQV